MFRHTSTTKSSRAMSSQPAIAGFVTASPPELASRRGLCLAASIQLVFGAMPLVRLSALAGPGERGGRARTRGTAQDLEPAHGGAEPAPHIRRQSRSVDEWFVGEAWEKRPQFLLRFFPSKVD